MRYDQESPMLYLRSLPETERHHANFVQDNLRKLATRLEEFESCLDLWSFGHEHAEAVHARNPPPAPFNMHPDADTRTKIELEAGRFQSWSQIALSHGAIVLQGAWDAIEGNNHLSRHCPQLMKLVDHDTKREAQNQFKRDFPDFSGARTAAAHPGLFSTTPKEVEKHAVTDGVDLPGVIKAAPGATLSIESGTIVIAGGARYLATFNRQTVSYDLSVDSVAKLSAIIRLYWTAFTPAEDPRAIRFRERLLGDSQ